MVTVPLLCEILIPSSSVKVMVPPRLISEEVVPSVMAILEFESFEFAIEPANIEFVIVVHATSLPSVVRTVFAPPTLKYDGLFELSPVINEPLLIPDICSNPIALSVILSVTVAVSDPEPFTVMWFSPESEIVAT